MSGGVRASVGDSQQMMLDAGQKKFGATQCKECGLIYEHADPDDEELHTQHHNRVRNALTYSVRLVYCFAFSTKNILTNIVLLVHYYQT